MFSRLFVPTVNVAEVAFGVIALPIGAGLLVDVVTGLVLVAVVAALGLAISSDGGMAGILAGVLPTALLLAAGVVAVLANGVAGLTAGVVAVVANGVAELTAGVVAIAAGVVTGDLPIVGLSFGSAGLAAGEIAVDAAGLLLVANGAEVAGVVCSVMEGVAVLTTGVVAGALPTGGLLAESVGLAAGEIAGLLPVADGVAIDEVVANTGGAEIEGAGDIAGITGGVAGVSIVAGGLTPIVGAAADETVGRLSAIGGTGKLDLVGATVVRLRLPVLADKAIGLLRLGATTSLLGAELTRVLALAAALFSPVGDPPT